MKDRQVQAILKVLEPKLNVDQRRLLQLIHAETRKDGKVTFRMPAGVISLEGIWEQVVATCAEMGIEYVKAGMFATLEELDGILGEVEWLWYPLIPKGFITLVVGDPGVGKSALVLDFVKAVTNGSRFPLTEGKPFKPANIVWIDTEASQQILNIRAKSMGIDRSKIHIPIIDGDLLSQPNIGIDEHREQIINLVEYAKPELLVLDSLGGSHSRGENKVEDMRPVMEFFALLARNSNLAVSIIHHLNKARIDEAAEIALYRIRGSTIIPALSRSILSLEAAAENLLKLRCIKNNLARIAKPISVIPINAGEDDIIGFNYQPYEPPPPKQTKRERCAHWVEKILHQNAGSIPLTELIELGTGEGYSRGNIYAAREVLGESIHNTGTGNKAVWNLVTAPLQDVSAVTKLKKGMNNGKHAPRN